MYYVPLTDEEKEYIRVNYKSMSISQMSKNINRTRRKVSEYLDRELDYKAVSGSTWTEEEISSLIKLAKNHTIAQLSKKLKKSREAISRKCYDYNIMTKNSSVSWTDEEIEFLKEAWGSETLVYIRQKLFEILRDSKKKELQNKKNIIDVPEFDIVIRKRTFKAISAKAKRLGLPPITDAFRSEEITLSEFSDMMGISRDRITACFPLHTRKLTNKMSVYYVDLKEALRYIHKHQNDFDASLISQYLFLPEPKWLIEKRKLDSRTKEHLNWCAYTDNYKWSDSEVQKLTLFMLHNMNIKNIYKQFPNRNRNSINVKIMKLLYEDVPYNYPYAHDPRNHLKDNDKYIAGILRNAPSVSHVSSYPTIFRNRLKCRKYTCNAKTLYKSSKNINLISNQGVNEVDCEMQLVSGGTNLCDVYASCPTSHQPTSYSDTNISHATNHTTCNLYLSVNNTSSNNSKLINGKPVRYITPGNKLNACSISKPVTIKVLLSDCKVAKIKSSVNAGELRKFNDAIMLYFPGLKVVLERNIILR